MDFRKTREGLFKVVFLLICLYFSDSSFAQDRYQYPKFLSRSYFGISIGYLNYPFSNEHLPAGYNAGAVKIPNLAVKVTLLGYRFNNNLSAQITYMRPVDWVQYKNINGDHVARSVYMNVGGLTFLTRFPLGKKFSIHGEGGLAIVTRNGFEITGVPVVKDVTFASVIVGGGLQYHLNKKWDLLVTATYTPKSTRQLQPQIFSLMGGFRYNMNPLSSEVVERNRSAGYFFPKNLLQIGYTTNLLGYDVNLYIDKTRLFWGGGNVEVKSGLSLNYQRNIFHGRKVFAFDLGASFSHFTSRKKEEGFFTLSVYPVFRFNLVRSRPADFYITYSLAGPTYISKSVVDEERTGTRFTFRDYMGIGMFSGKNRNINAEINIGHFSNGNIFPDNGGFKVPLSFNLGYTF